MNPLEQVNGYLRSLEPRLRWRAISRGIAVIALAALVATVVLVLYHQRLLVLGRQPSHRPPAAVSLSGPCLGFGLVLPLLA